MPSNSTNSAMKVIWISFAISILFFGVIKQLDSRFRNPYYHGQQTKRSSGVILRGIPLPFFLEKESKRTFTAEEQKTIENNYKKPRYIKNILENKHWYKNTGLRSLLSTIAWIAFVIFAIGVWDSINRFLKTR